MTQNVAQIGVVSDGTMRVVDLVPKFLDQLKELDEERCTSFCSYNKDELDVIFDSEDDYGLSADMYWILDELFSMLNEYCPPFVYFGASIGDGASYGYFVSDDALDDAVRFNELLKLKPGEEIPEDCDAEYVLFSDDKGFDELCDVDGNVIWSI